MSKEEALRRIKEAAETGAMTLSLTGLDLTELPPELFELTKLRLLDSNWNNLSSLPPEIVQLPKLERLALYGNPLTRLP